jgi:hypothetical protein
VAPFSSILLHAKPWAYISQALMKQLEFFFSW